jgi:hypothetical protein
MPSGGSVHSINAIEDSAHVRGTSLADLGSEHGAQSVPQQWDCLVADVDPVRPKGILDVAQRQRRSARNGELLK